MSESSGSKTFGLLLERIERVFAMLYILPTRIRDDDHERVVETELRRARIAASPGVVKLLNTELVTELRPLQLDERTRFEILRIHAFLKPGILRPLGLSSFLERPDGTTNSPWAFLSAYAFKYGSEWCVVDAARGHSVLVEETPNYVESDSNVCSVSLPYLKRIMQAFGITYRAAQESGNTLLYANGHDPTKHGLSIPAWEYRYYLSASGTSAKIWPSFHDLLWACLRNRKF